MRLRIIHKILELNISSLNISISNQGNNNYRISGIQSFIEAVREIERTGVLKSETNRINRINIISETPLDSFVVDQQTKNEIQGGLNTLKNRAQSLYDALEDLLTSEAEDSLSFKLPNNIQFSEIPKIIEKLNKVLEQLLVNEYVNGKIEFQGFERGSSWIEITVGSIAALNLFSGVIDLIFEWRIKLQEIEAREKMIEDLDVQVDAKKQIIDAFKKEKDDIFKCFLSKLKEDSGISQDDNDIEERLKYSINELTKMIGKGLEVHPSLTSPPEIRKRFPDAENLLKTIKLLPPSTDNESDLDK